MCRHMPPGMMPKNVVAANTDVRTPISAGMTLATKNGSTGTSRMENSTDAPLSRMAWVMRFTRPSLASIFSARPLPSRCAPPGRSAPRRWWRAPTLNKRARKQPEQEAAGQRGGGRAGQRKGDDGDIGQRRRPARSARSCHRERPAAPRGCRAGRRSSGNRAAQRRRWRRRHTAISGSLRAMRRSGFGNRSRKVLWFGFRLHFVLNAACVANVTALSRVVDRA